MTISADDDRQLCLYIKINVCAHHMYSCVNKREYNKKLSMNTMEEKKKEKKRESNKTNHF